MQETVSPQVRATYALKLRTPDQIMAEIDKCQKYLDSTPADASPHFRQTVLGRISILEWVLSGD